MSTIIEKVGFTNKQAYSLCVIVLLMVGGYLLPPEAYEYFFTSATEISREVIREEIMGYIDQGLGGSPWQTEKSDSFQLGWVDVAGVPNYYMLNGTSGKMWEYSITESDITGWTRGNESGMEHYMTDIKNATGYCREADGLPDNHSIGLYVWGQAGEDLDLGQIVFLDGDGDYNLIDCNATTTMYAVAVVAEDISNTGWGFFMIQGYMRCDAWSAWTIGSETPILAGWTVGDMTQTLPNSTGDQVQRIAYALASKIVYFDFDSTVVEVA